VAGNVSRQYLKAMGIDCWVPRKDNVDNHSSGADASGQGNAATDLRGQPENPAPPGHGPAASGNERSINVARQTPEPVAPAMADLPPWVRDQQPIAQCPPSALDTLLAECRVVVADQVATSADDARPMLLVLERDLTSPAEDLLAAMLKAIKVDRLSQYAATVSQTAAAKALADVCGQLHPSLVLVMATVSDSTALSELEFHRSELHRFGWLDVPVAITLHPQVLLENPQGKRPAWEDLKRVKAFLDGR